MRGAALVLSAVTLSGCQEHFDRRDTITYGIGDSIEINKATQAIERWPNAARYDRWPTDGERTRIAIEKYRKREVAKGAAPAGSAAAVTTNAGP
ncbi:MAG: hypothetical protein ACKVP4_07430 [Hyphomicrobium sp.]